VAGNQGTYLSVLGEAIAASRQPPWEALSMLQVMAQSENWRHTRGLGFSVNEVLPYAAYGESRLVEGLAQMRSAQTALAVERYRLANGGTPDNAGLLVPAFLPAVPADPCDGQPLRYKPLGDGYLVYSRGASGQNVDDAIAGSGSGVGYVFRVMHTQ